MKNIIIINSYANTDEKLNVLFNYILQIKKSNNHILLTSHLPLPSNIVELVNYYIYDKENLLLPIERSPVVWFADYEEYINLNCSRHAYTIIKNVYNSLNFAKSLGYKNFIFSEGDCVFNNEGVDKLQCIYDILENTNKKLFMFKLENQIYNKHKFLYITNFFAGNIDYFLKNIPLVKSFEEWCNVPPYSNGSEMLESLFVEMIQPLLNETHEETRPINSYFNESEIDVFHTFDNFYQILYNLENKNKPVFFTVGNGGYYELTINNQLVVSRHYNRGELFKYKFDINENDTIVQLKINDIVVITRSINVSTVEECKKFGVRGKIK
jgi:hypothetical protein